MRDPDIPFGVTYDDLLLLPAYSEVLPTEIQTKSRATRNVEVMVPILSSAMDTVTEARLAIALAKEGGLGVIHKNCSPEEQARCVPVAQRLVRRHERSGRVSLFLSAHIGRIQGWPTPEAIALVRELTEFATQARYVYTHTWAVGDLVIWDNGCTMHRGRSYEDQIYPRELRRVTTEGSRSTLQQPGWQA